jgi:secondary-alkyl amine dehydrogenase [NAD(P)+]
MKAKPKCIIYGTGFVGQELTRLIIDRGWTIAAAFNRAGEKVGKDLGEVAGLGHPLGVEVQDCDTADDTPLDADIALIATTNSLAQNLQAYERFFKAGINVLCHGTESYYPFWIDQKLATRIDTMARNAGVSFTGGGIWDSSRIWSGILAAGPCVHIDSMLHKTQTDVLRQGLYWEKVLGIGLEEEEWHQKLAPLKAVTGKTVQIPSVSVLEKLGLTISEAINSFEPVIRDHDCYCAALDKNIPAGASLGMRFLVDVATQEGVTARTEYETRAFEEGEVEEMRWVISGRPGNEVRYIRNDSGIASASSLLNRVRDVIAAPPGVFEITRMGPIIAELN